MPQIPPPREISFKVLPPNYPMITANSPIASRDDNVDESGGDIDGDGDDKDAREICNDYREDDDNEITSKDPLQRKNRK